MVFIPMLIATFRLVLIIALVTCNLAALCSVTEAPKKKKKYCNISQLSLICTLLVNLFYVSCVWTPFTIRTFTHYIRILTEDNLPIVNVTFNDIQSIPASSNNFSTELHQRNPRWAKIESVGHEGTWSLAYPIIETESQIETGNPIIRRDKVTFPSYIAVDCNFQDVVTSACIYSLAFVSIMKLIFMNKPIFLPNTYGTLTGYMFLTTAFPILATFVIRYGETIGVFFSLHNPDEIRNGYTMYNIICDVRLDENYIFLSFLEWSSIIVVLLLAVVLILRIAEIPSGDLNTLKKEQTSYSKGEWISDYPVYLATIWAWPLKPTLLVIFYVMFGQHWTNTIAWVSHLIVSISTVFLVMSAFFSRELYIDEDLQTEIDTEKNKPNTNRRLDEKTLCSEVVVLTNNLIIPIVTKDDLKDKQPPTYQECTEEDAPFTYVPLSDDADLTNSKSASDIRNKIKESIGKVILSKYFISRPSLNRGKKEDQKIILHNEDSNNTSDV